MDQVGNVNIESKITKTNTKERIEGYEKKETTAQNAIVAERKSLGKRGDKTSQSVSRAKISILDIGLHASDVITDNVTLYIHYMNCQVNCQVYCGK